MTILRLGLFSVPQPERTIHYNSRKKKLLD